MRQPIYWLMLATLISLMIGKSLIDYLHRDESPKKTYVSEEWALKSRLILESMAGKSAMQSQKTLDSTLQSLDKARKKDELAEAYYAIASYEESRKVPVDSIDHLAKSKDPNLNTLGKIYAAKKLTRQDAWALSSSLPSSFRYKLAGSHALEKSGDKGARGRVISNSAKVILPLVFLAVGMVVMLGAAILFGYAVLYANGTVQILGPPAGVLDPAEADQFAGKAAQMLTMFLFLSLVAGVVASSGVFPKSANIYLNLSLAFLIIGGTFVLLRRDPISLRRIGWSKQKFGTHFVWGLGAAIANAPIVLGLSLLGSFVFRGLPQAEHPVESILAGSLSPLKLVALFVLASVQAPIFEESTFRGLIQPALHGVVRRPWLAGFISSFCFAAVHPTGIPAWPALAAIGGMSAFLTYQTKSLVPSMIMHGLHNAATLIMALAIFQV